MEGAGPVVGSLRPHRASVPSSGCSRCPHTGHGSFCGHPDWDRHVPHRRARSEAAERSMNKCITRLGNGGTGTATATICLRGPQGPTGLWSSRAAPAGSHAAPVLLGAWSRVAGARSLAPRGYHPSSSHGFPKRSPPHRVAAGASCRWIWMAGCGCTLHPGPGGNKATQVGCKLSLRGDNKAAASALSGAGRGHIPVFCVRSSLGWG